MKKITTILLVPGGFIFIYFGIMTFRSLSVEGKSEEIRTDHFIIAYHGIFNEEARKTADRLEGNYDRIRKNLKDPDHEIIRVFIHPTQADFNKGTGLLNSQANGTSRGPNEFHILWTIWFNTIFPHDPVKTAIHEFTHCVQLNVLIENEQKEFNRENNANFEKYFEEKFANEYPQWFWEALSDYEAGIVNKISVKYGMRKKPTLEFLNNNNQVYNVGYTIIEYIVQKWGPDKIPELITSYVDIKKVLNISEPDFEKGWIDFVKEKY